MFSASVELAVRQTWSGCGQPNSAASASRAAKIGRAAARLSAWALRPLLPMVCMACTTASMTQGGLRRVVAALSR